MNLHIDVGSSSHEERLEKENTVDFSNVYEDITCDKKSFIIFSPTSKSSQEPMKYFVQKCTTAEKVLICAKFQEALWLEFGSVSVKSTNFQNFQLNNPNKSKPVNIKVDKLNSKHGLSIAFSGSSKQEVEVPPLEVVRGTVFWTPQYDISIREIISLKMDDKLPLQITVHGSAGTGKREVDLMKTKKEPEKKEIRRKLVFESAPPAPPKKVSSATTSFTSQRPGISTAPTTKQQTLEAQLETESEEPIPVEWKLVTNCSKSPPKKLLSFDKIANNRLRVRSKDHSKVKDNWSVKQTQSFTEWINYTFAHTHWFKTTPENTQLEAEEAALVKELLPSPTKAAKLEIKSVAYAQGLRELMHRRYYAKNLRSGVNLFYGPTMTKAVCAMEREVDNYRIAMRGERDVHADLGMQESLFELLFCYEFPWLRFGLEVVFGQVAANLSQMAAVMSNRSSIEISRLSQVRHTATPPCVTGCGRWKSSFKAFVYDHFLSDKAIASQFSKQKLLYVSEEKKMKDLLRKHMLKKFLTLILFLDAARIAQLLPITTLFHKDAPFKSSKLIIISFCRVFLRGEGDIVRHLAHLGWHFQFEQMYIDEYDYTLKNIAVDLRDGVRLARLIEILSSKGTNPLNLTELLRVPAVSRLQKIYNINLVLEALYEPDEKGPQAKHIVDGNRDMTLMLLWKVMFQFELHRLLGGGEDGYEIIRRETKAVRRSARWRKSARSVDELASMAVGVHATGDGKGDLKGFNCTKCGGASDVEGECETCSVAAAVSSGERKSSEVREGLLRGAILQWCTVVAEPYLVPVHNLSSSLADGRALCLLVHYYHPTLLPVKMIRKTTAHLPPAVIQGARKKNSKEAEEMNKSLLAERKNFLLLRRACQGIGGVPYMLPDNLDSKNVPEEKTMIMFLSYLFLRLVETSEQLRAVIRIQRWFLCHCPPSKQTPLFDVSLNSDVSTEGIGEAVGTQTFMEETRESTKPRNLVSHSTNTEPIVVPTKMAATEDVNEKVEAPKVEERKRRRRDMGEEAMIETMAETFMETMMDDQPQTETFKPEQKTKAHVEKPKGKRSKRATSRERHHTSPKRKNHVPVTIAISKTQASDVIGMRLLSYTHRKRFLSNLHKKHGKEPEYPTIETEEDSIVSNVTFNESANISTKTVPPRVETSWDSDSIHSASDAVLHSPVSKSFSYLDQCTPYESQQNSIVPNGSTAELTQSELDEEKTRSPSLSFTTEEEFEPGNMTSSVSQWAEPQIDRLVQETEEPHPSSRHSSPSRMSPVKDEHWMEEAKTLTMMEMKLFHKSKVLADYDFLQKKGKLSVVSTSDEVAAAMRDVLNARDGMVSQQQSEKKARLLAEFKTTNVKLSSREPTPASTPKRRAREEALRVRAEEMAKNEQAARAAVEKRLEEEREARMKVEAKLEALENARYEEERQRNQEKSRAMVMQRLKCALVLQSWWRGSLARLDRWRLNVTISKFQALQRGRKLRKTLRTMDETVRRFQVFYRLGKQRRAFLKARELRAKKLQTCWRGNKVRNEFLRMKKAAVLLQSLLRAMKAQRDFGEVKLQIVKAQAFCRGGLDRKRYREKREQIRRFHAAATIQAIIRRIILRKRYLNLLKSIIRVQKAWVCAVLLKRGKVLRAEMAYQRKKLRELQFKCAWTLHKFMKKSIPYLKALRLTRKVQLWYRSRVLPFIRIRTMRRGFSLLQTCFRGRMIRVRSNHKVQVALRRIRRADERAQAEPSMRLGRRTEFALSILQKGKMISQLIKACQHLEASTEHSLECCESFAQAGAAKVLFGLLRSCNRSTPQQELLRIALVVLLNVARHHHLAASLATVPESTDALVDLLQMFRDKNSIFLLTAELLTRLAYSSSATRDTCNKAVYRKRLEGIQHILERKFRLEMKIHTASNGKEIVEDDVYRKSLDLKFNLEQDYFDPITCMQQLMLLLNS